MKNSCIASVLMLLMAIGATAQKQEVFAPDGKAINGYDAVAFFEESKAVKGFDSLTYQYKDVQWLFSSKTNLETFKANPAHYIPQYGGYCAYGTAEGHKAPTQTDTWTIVNDKLYFNYNMKVKQSWLKDQPALIQKADRQWPVVKQQE
ncbi:YHS domain-containing (seleno)protein [Parachryseolinea silvisoli]|uniref:YHS domain-containing (seleno)protein n=1 Tax=Parachryseolinea silvisoli TaxID=2873601 RepID=UPI0022658696|nr:YHS domain-containing (seleno)protein [Parachryseolinea silvisoli]MCD9015886.1 YHS domain protein [Parachryseolinea silvisoli]